MRRFAGALFMIVAIFGHDINHSVCAAVIAIGLFVWKSTSLAEGKQ